MMSSSPSSAGLRRSSGGSSTTTGCCGGGSGGVIVGACVRPQPVTETSLMDSVGSFINEVQAYNHHPSSSDPKIQVTWARFEVADINDVGLFPEALEINGNCPPLLLILGYTAGVQVWLIPITGEAQEVLSWKQGQVKTLRILPTPENVFGCPDNFAHVRPMIALSDSTGPGAAFSSVSFISLKSGEQVHNIKFNSEIADIAVNRKVVLMSFREKLAVFGACNLEARFTITSCFPSPGVDWNPLALGDRWLAYADQRMMPMHKSFGGMEMDGSQSVTAWGINVGSKLAQGVSKIYSNIFTSSSSSSSASSASRSTPMTSPSSSSSSSGNSEPQKGVVTILDILQVHRPDHEEINVADKIDGVIAHFVAHNKAIVAMKFDYSGSLLLTCDRLGNYFNLFRIVPHPSGSCYGSVHHLYSLYRGDTPGMVQDIAFSPDSRWVAVSTLRGTTHFFPITPYGGPVGVRTHTSHRVVNRLSRFHRSAGIDEGRAATPAGGGRTSPNPTLGSSPATTSGSSSMGSHVSKIILDSPPPVMPYPNPHVPPFPTPTLIQPVAQLRQPYLLSSLQQLGGSVVSSGTGRKVGRTGSGSSGLDDIPIRLACIFAPSRAWLIGTQHNMFTRQQRNKNIDSLFVMANHGVLLEYSLDPIPDPTLPKEKICESSPVELQVSAYGQWSLCKPRDKAELQPPLPIDNPLMMPLNKMGQLKDSSGDGTFPGGRMDADEDDQWLSQVEIITHIGPPRRLWMGPQFSFKTLQPIGDDGNEMRIMDVNSRPKSSNPVNMIGRGQSVSDKSSSSSGNIPVLIEAGSASSSFELSPRFADNFHNNNKSSSSNNKPLDLQDVESELQEAMSETVLPEDNILDGDRQQHRKEEEFFCLTPEDSRSMTTTIVSSSSRSRNASASDNNTTTKAVSVEMAFDTKIFSVAVEASSSSSSSKESPAMMKICPVDSDFTGRFAVVSSIARKDDKFQGLNILEEEEKQQPKRNNNNNSNSNNNNNKKTKNKKSKKKELKTVQDRECTPAFREEKTVDLLLDKDAEMLLAEAVASVVKPPPANETLVTEVTLKKDEEIISEKQTVPIGTSAAKPEVLTWVDDFFNAKDSNAIIKEIEKAGEKYDDSEGSPAAVVKNGGTPWTTTTTSSSCRPTDSSEDDGEVFQPTTRHNKKKQKHHKSFRTESESTDGEGGINDPEPEGWSFEADDIDINKLISEVVNNEAAMATVATVEKTSLEDVFKFDSEMVSLSKSNSASKFDNATTSNDEEGGISSSVGGGSTSESSVGNSPNPKKTKSRNKKKKSRR